MWFLFLGFLILFFYLLEVVIPLPFLLLLVISQTSFDQPKTSALSAFLIGLLLDLGNSRWLGVTALFCLLVSLLFKLYRRKFNEESLGFLFIFAFVTVNVYLRIFQANKFIFPIEGLIGAVFTLTLTSLLYSLWKKTF